MDSRCVLPSSQLEPHHPAAEAREEQGREMARSQRDQEALAGAGVLQLLERWAQDTLRWILGPES